MSPVIETEVHRTENGGDWTMSDLHERSVKENSKEKKMKVWSEWASSYDDDVNAEVYLGPTITVNRILDLIANDKKRCAGEEIRILDAGCGTGLCGEHLKTTAEYLSGDISLIGIDYSKDMLLVAESRQYYTRLHCGDLNESLIVPKFSVDYCVSAGVFLEGYCGPPALFNVLQSLKRDGYASITVRNQSFVTCKGEYLKAIDDAGCEIVRNDVMPYLGEVVANYLMIRKSRSFI